MNNEVSEINEVREAVKWFTDHSTLALCDTDETVRPLHFSEYTDIALKNAAILPQEAAVKEVQILQAVNLPTLLRLVQVTLHASEQSEQRVYFHTKHKPTERDTLVLAFNPPLTFQHDAYLKIAAWGREKGDSETRELFHAIVKSE